MMKVNVLLESLLYTAKYKIGVLLMFNCPDTLRSPFCKIFQLITYVHVPNLIVKFSSSLRYAKSILVSFVEVFRELILSMCNQT